MVATHVERTEGLDRVGSVTILRYDHWYGDGVDTPATKGLVVVADRTCLDAWPE
jgi:hypothetical protein